MNGLRFKVRLWVGDGEPGWSCPGLGESGLGRWMGRGVGWGVGGGSGRKNKIKLKKTSNLSPCPVPLVDKLNVKCQWGERETDIYLAEFGSERRDEFKGIRLEGVQTRPHTE